MKNISRRVFIKGLAVAGVAAAASTVLAGCNTNMIPGVDDGAEDGEEVPAPSTSKVLEYEDEDDADTNLKITAQDLTFVSAPYGEEGTATIKLQTTNNLGSDLVFVTTEPATATTTNISATDRTKVANGNYFVLVSVYKDGGKNDTLAVSSTLGSKDNNVMFSNADAAPDAGKTTNSYLWFSGANKAEKTITLKLTLKKAEVASSSAIFHTLKEQTITYTL